MRIEERIAVDAPREKVWKAVSDIAHADAFMEGMSFSAVEGEPATGPRARYTVRVHVGSAHVGGVVEVIEWDPPHELAWTSITGIQQRGRWILHGNGRTTDVILRVGYQAPGGVTALLADYIGGRTVRRNVRRSLDALKRMVEVR